MRDYEAQLTEDAKAWLQSICEDLAEQMPTEFGRLELPQRVYQ